jgi:hypothetical protein
MSTQEVKVRIWQTGKFSIMPVQERWLGFDKEPNPQSCPCKKHMLGISAYPFNSYDTENKCLCLNVYKNCFINSLCLHSVTICDSNLYLNNVYFSDKGKRESSPYNMPQMAGGWELR